ncbi:carbohydrate ABC transporter permease [Nonomuraea cavernae]|uniref:Amino acid ABC transporter permease n=1 Tax=Nonomuraea cavernae TaxID=2045107 RepID=A0A918DJQ6_9ACTN|nr:sugar ABC transporter permease [Nonomuraea cavernae]MCA2190499.1 sugar ABC transporter permease [Nonomuraea cavernae]GGO70544.1 amino acid ABC transporter permease [Nonomuraea cavernae]
MAQATSPPEARDDAPARRYSVDAAGLGRLRAGAFVAPALALITVFLVFPALWVIYLGLMNYRLTGVEAVNPKIVGADNFIKAISDPAFWDSTWLTFQFVLGSAVIGQVVLGFSIAWMLRDRRGTLKSVVEGLVILAWILPGAVVAFLWVALLDRDSGTLNALLGIPGFPWLLDHPMLSIIIFNTWRGTAFSMMLYGAALGNVPPSHLESARLAGASGWQQLRDVVFPHIRGHILTNLLLISLWTFNDFSPFLLTAGGPDGKSEVLAVHVYKVALQGGDLGYGAAISTIILLINLVVAVFYLRLLRSKK